MTQQHEAPALFGYDLFGEQVQQRRAGPLEKRFEWAPFSVLSAREGDWQERKRAWLSMGIQSELGRGDDLTYTGHARLYDYYRVKEGTKKETQGSGTSVFDPVLCELMYRWFCPPAGQVVDPFAGGSVRGIVAASLGLHYWGMDLSQAQVEANREQVGIIPGSGTATWVVGDSTVGVGAAPEADYIFTCPPYGDLEVYSDDPADLSTMDYPTFMYAIGSVLTQTHARLKPNRFATWVVGDFRDKRGMYRGFVADLIVAARDAGFGLYNEAILITPAGTLPVRTSVQFPSTRKLGRTHQNILVFVKGDPKAATAAVKGG